MAEMTIREEFVARVRRWLVEADEEPPYAKIRYKHGPVHAVAAAGTDRDGSLYNFYTLCGRRITEVDQWQEERRTHTLECASCERVVAAWAKLPERKIDIFPPEEA